MSSSPVMRSFVPCLLGLLSVLGLLPLCGCGDQDPETEADFQDVDEQEVAVVKRPPVLIDEASMVRLLAAMKELQDYSRGHPMIRQQGETGPGVMPIGAGVTALLGDGCQPILARHGFESSLQFDSLMAHTQRAMQKIKQGDHGGFNGLDRQYQLRGALSAARKYLTEVESDSGLSPDQKRLISTDTRKTIEDLERQQADISDFANDLKENYDQIPALNLETVRRHFDELTKLMNP
ncbi:MAG: hypothetical protein V2A76_17345 [Planctomycetota bacterium]